MLPFETLRSAAFLFEEINIDTDAILPKQFLTTIRREGLAEGLFFEQRRAAAERQTRHLLDRVEMAGRRILVANQNFGCGSSREHAVWALLDYGFGAIVAPSFGSIFLNNATNCGLLCAEVSGSDHGLINDALATQPDLVIEVSLENCRILLDGRGSIPFAVDEADRANLLAGTDLIDRTMRSARHITAFEAVQRRLHPWLDTGAL
ncbi:3-isopropylmalate dehydratase small subunit [Sulfitobacter porphyrae]|uniref:3-isopropylmalate dehydratase n=1 Tax=Sulfitobacter porphyrae TaxID=1246864 RepID=A0ABW2B7U5_9RHOB|nr:3-isopropylmalate dehydratase small subunit [Sulfitobacter porphyrae]